jgi:hypothetical protein
MPATLDGEVVTGDADGRPGGGESAKPGLMWCNQAGSAAMLEHL